MKMKNLLIGAIALPTLLYGWTLGVGSYSSRLNSGVNPYNQNIITAKTMTVDLKILEYTEAPISGCELEERALFRGRREFNDVDCDGKLERISTDLQTRTRFLPEDEKLFLKADKEYNALLNKYNLKERVDKYREEHKLEKAKENLEDLF